MAQSFQNKFDQKYIYAKEQNTNTMSSQKLGLPRRLIDESEDFFLGIEPVEPKPITFEEQELMGKAWLMIVGRTNRAVGIEIMTDLEQKGIIEAAFSLARFTKDRDQRKQLLKKVANTGHSEGMFQYAYILPHSSCPNPENEDDAYWESLISDAAEKGCVKAMHEMGNIYRHRQNFAESMYWYSMTFYNNHIPYQFYIEDLAQAWKEAGMPRNYHKGSSKFDEARFKCACLQLEIFSRQKTNFPIDELVRMATFQQVPFAGYIAGEIYEAYGNYRMATTVFKILSHENDLLGLRRYGDMLMLGIGCEKNIERAKKMYTEAANRGEYISMYALGQLMRESNKNMAAFWYGLSSAYNYGNALRKLLKLTKE